MNAKKIYPHSIIYNTWDISEPRLKNIYNSGPLQPFFARMKEENKYTTFNKAKQKAKQ